jgi:transposase
MHAGVAPLECSSGALQRHRLSPVGNRQLNAALHRIAVTQLRVHPAAQADLMRQRTAGKSKREALRVLKRRFVCCRPTVWAAQPLTRVSLLRKERCESCRVTCGSWVASGRLG